MERNKVEAAKLLRQVAADEKKKLTARNEYKEDSDEYNVTHPNAISDGDEKGKGLNGDNAGSSTDINQRKKQLVQNMFGENNPYKNPDAS